MSPNTTPTATNGAPTTTPRAPYVPPTLERLGSWSALTTQATGGVGFVQLPIISKIVDGLR